MGIWTLDREGPMTSSPALDRFLNPDPRDVGCAGTMELLHVYVDLRLADLDPERRYPGVAAHLRVCGPCSTDFEGLLAAAGGRPPSENS
jgi:hypothetical protein